ncbi:MAG: hypothetical protein H0T42_01715, partial [Deltaproteobacteria bacterium]|nr:hypothetical protein [Deltaproteobacteria bacterium]
MRLALVALPLAAVALAGAHVAREQAKTGARTEVGDRPYAPSPTAAPIVTLGYRELAADLLFARLIGYWGSEHNEAAAIADLAEAITALDPRFRRVYDFGAIAMTGAQRGVDNSVRFRAIKLLEAAARAYPTQWRYPNLAGQIYLADLQTDDPALRRSWDEKGTLLLESSARKPYAPAEAGMNAVALRSRFGQHQRALDGLRELLLITEDSGARARIVAKLGELSKDVPDEMAAELLQARKEFEAEWTRER